MTGNFQRYGKYINPFIEKVFPINFEVKADFDKLYFRFPEKSLDNVGFNFICHFLKKQVSENYYTTSCKSIRMSLSELELSLGEVENTFILLNYFRLNIIVKMDKKGVNKIIDFVDNENKIISLSDFLKSKSSSLGNNILQNYKIKLPAIKIIEEEEKMQRAQNRTDFSYYATARDAFDDYDQFLNWMHAK